MKKLVGFSRIFVGVLFIISGLIKLNDPLGFSFKLQEYFAPEVLNLEFLAPYALTLSIVVVIFEVLLGITLLLGFAVKFTIRSLITLIVFFTFLTFYSAYFNKVTDCGCFGDAIKLTPWESFTKDIILLVFILILWRGERFIKPILPVKITRILVFLSVIISSAFAYYVLAHLPAKDFRPYKIGASIIEGMEIPENAPKPIFEYRWKFELNGEEIIRITEGDYPKQEGTFIGVETKEIQEGYEPPIHDFTIEKNGVDYTAQVLDKDKVVVVIAYNIETTKRSAYSEIKKATDLALENGYEVIGLSASSEALTQAIVDENDMQFDFYFCDETTLKTIVRSNPGLLVLKQGTIQQKWHWRDASKLILD